MEGLKMAGSPELKIYTADGRYVAALKEYEAAAAVVTFYGEGATVRLGHSKSLTVWTEGVDGVAAVSYDEAAATMIRNKYRNREESK